MEEKKEPKKVTKQQLVVQMVELKEDNDGNIQKVIFVTDKGNITYKPKIGDEGFEDHYKIHRPMKPCRRSDLTPFMNELAKMAHIEGKASVLGSYMVWETKDADNNDVIYRFVQGNKMFEEWSFTKVDDKVIVDGVAE